MSLEPADLESAAAAEAPRWFVVRTTPKGEHLAARQLARHEGIEPFAPRLSYWKNTARGRIRWTEALFPGYCLARFAWSEGWRLVNSTAGVTGLVRFDRLQAPPFLDEAEIADLRERCGVSEVVELVEDYRPGDEVEVVAGPMRGLRVLVTRVLPAAQRLGVLMEMLGQAREVQVSLASVASQRQPPPILRRPAAASAD